MGNQCTPTAPNRRTSWGPGRTLQQSARGSLEVSLDSDAGDTPVMYNSPTKSVDCLGLCRKDTTSNDELILPNGTDTPFKCGVCIVRHGERQDQVDPAAWFKSDLGRAYPFDCPLTQHGRVQARRVAEDLQDSGLEFSLVVCSPYVRCVQTAAAMCEVLGLQLAIDCELGEIYGPRTHGQWKKPPPRRVLEEISCLTTINGVPLMESPMFVRNEGQEFFGTHSVWPENLEDARLRLVSRVEQYLARGLQLRRNFVLVTHGDCVAASLGLLLSSQPGPRRIVTKIDYCAYAVAQRMVEPGDMYALGLADELAGWSLVTGNCQVSNFDDRGGGPWKGPFDPYPIQEEAQRVKNYEEMQRKDKQDEMAQHNRRGIKRSSTTVLQSALHRQKSRDVLNKMDAFDVQYGELVPDSSGSSGGWGLQITSPQDIMKAFTGQ